MPLFNIVSNKNFSTKEKQDVSRTLTDLLIDNWKVLPDKIQTQISIVNDDEMARGGVSLSNESFSKLSRRTTIGKESYYTSLNINDGKETLITITIDTWTGFSFVDKTNLATKITQYLIDEHNFLGDNIVIYFRDIIPENWFQNGISGRNPEFLSKSRNVK